jgi:hypothetical protein
MLQKALSYSHPIIIRMKTQLSHPESDGASLRPRIIDVSEDRYATVKELVEPGDTAHFERKGGETTLVIR